VRVGIGGGVLVVATRLCKNAQSISAARAWRAAHESLLFDDLDAFNDRPFEWVHWYNRRRPTMASRCALRWIYSLTNLAISAGCTGPIQTLDSDGTFVRLTGYLHPWWAFASSRLPHDVGDFARPEAQRYRL